MPNLSQLKRQRMLEFLNKIKAEHTDDESLIAINEIESELNDKKYGLVWEEHQEQVDIEMMTKVPVFTEVADREIASDEELPYNFLLEGDNLHSLKLLEKTHKGKIDVIYIDPPYNTGNSFIYDDCMVGDDDSFKHSKWLSFMKARISITQQLLSKEGIIFISINDYELAPLRLLCDDIFGENNFVGHLTWESTTQPTNAGKARFALQKKVESILCYAKNKELKPDFVLKGLASDLKYPHIGKYGACRFEIIEKSDAGAYKRDTMKFQILGQYPREGKRWQIGLETAKQLEKDGKVEIVDGIVKRAVYPEDEFDKRKFIPFWSHFPADYVGTAQNGKDELNKIMGMPVGFDTVKPTKLIKEILSHFKSNIIVLDFFAGSGTTAQAVMELNTEDGGNRKFILCTNNENCICEDITYQRIETVITGTRKDGSDYSEGIPANLKYYKTDYIDKTSPDPDYNIEGELLKHIAEMVQLEYAVKLDGTNYVLIMSDEQADNFIANDESLARCKAIYVSTAVLLTAEQQKKLSDNGIAVFVIPDYYFESELLEVGER